MVEMRFLIAGLAQSTMAFVLLVAVVLVAALWPAGFDASSMTAAAANLGSRISELMSGPFATSATLIASAVGAALIVAGPAVRIASRWPDGFASRLIRATTAILGIMPAVLLVVAIPVAIRLVAPELIGVDGTDDARSITIRTLLPVVILATWAYPPVFRTMLTAVETPERLNAGRAAALPIGAIVSGLVVVEVVFHQPGLGTKFADALRAGEGGQLSAVTIVLAGAVFFTSALVHGALSSLAHRTT